MNNTLKGLIHGIIPAVLMTLAVGQIYAFTNFSSDIATYIGSSQSLVQIAFSLGIFFLGMGAAFFGKIVEKNIKISSLIGTVLFICGMFVTSIAVRCHSLALVYIGYGLLIGLGTGIIYVSPVKTMMLWFEKHKAVAAAVPIISFGLGSTLSTFLYARLISVGIQNIFIYFGLIYLVMMIIGIVLLKKPELSVSIALGTSEFSYKELLKNRFFIHSWLFMLLNISAGLCLIPLAKQMMNDVSVGYSAALITGIIALCGLFNGGGRLVFAFWSDSLKERINIIGYIIGISLLMIFSSLCWVKSIGLTLLIINACYGAGFSVIPGILSDKFGMSNISKIHGAVLSAWGIAGLLGNQIALLVGGAFGNIGVIVMLLVVHAVSFINFRMMKKA